MLTRPAHELVGELIEAGYSADAKILAEALDRAPRSFIDFERTLDHALRLREQKLTDRVRELEQVIATLHAGATQGASN